MEFFMHIVKRCALSILCLHVGITVAAPTPVVDIINPLTNGAVGSTPVITDDGRYVAYRHYLAPATRIEVFDRVTRTNEIVSVTAAGQDANGATSSPLISADGRYVLYNSNASNLDVPAGYGGIFVYDRTNHTTEAVVKAATVIRTMYAGMSRNGRYVAYRLREGDGTLNTRLYVRDMVAKTTRELGGATNLYVINDVGPAVSDDGRYVTYLGRPSSNGPYELMTYDTVSGVSTPDNLNSDGVRENISTGTTRFAASADGRYVAFVTISSNLDGIDPNAGADVFVRDRIAGTTKKISFGVNGAVSGAYGLSISADGRYVSYIGIGQSGGPNSMYRYDRLTNIGMPTPQAGDSAAPAISANGRYVAYDFGYSASATTRYLAVTDYGPPAELILSESTLALTEGGIARTYTAVLNQAPTANVALNIASAPQLQLARSQLTFTTANWNTPQVISVQALNDGVAQGPHSATINQKTASADPYFNVVPTAAVTATISDPVIPTIMPPSGATPNLALTGTAAPGVTVIVTAVNVTTGGLVSVSALADAQGNWSAALEGVGYGNIELQADANGVKSPVYPYTSVEQPPAR
jgi:hypothetical protein